MEPISDFVKATQVHKNNNNKTQSVPNELQETAGKSEAAHCADMMNCHILSAAHNATITGPKCRVCAAFTIEMRQSVGTEILIIPFPQGLRAALQSGSRETSGSTKTQTSSSLVSTPISKWLFKRGWRAAQRGELCVAVCHSASFVCCSPRAKQANMALGSHLIPHWRRASERMAAVRGGVAALRRVQKYLHQWC